MSRNDHEFFMRRAISLTANCPALPFGAVIVDQDSGDIVAEGWNRSAINPAWHGEVDALNRLAAGPFDRDSRTLALYSTAEPCPMCQSAILWAGIDTVVFGTSIRSLQQMGWRQIDIDAAEVIQRTPFRDCTLIGGVLANDCDQLFRIAKPMN